MKNELYEFNIDSAILWGSSEYESKEVEFKEEDSEEYLKIDNPINRISDIKY